MLEAEKLATSAGGGDPRVGLRAVAALRQPVGSARRGRLPFSPGAKRALQRGLREAVALRRNYVGTDHVLLGILAVPDDLGASALRSVGAVPEAVCDGILTELRRAS